MIIKKHFLSAWILGKDIKKHFLSVWILGKDLPFQSRDAPKDSRVKNIEGTSLLLKLSGNPFSQGQPDKKTLKKWGGNLR